MLASSDGISCWTTLKPQNSNSNPNPLANQHRCIDFLTPPTPLIIPHRLPAFLESLMLLKNWCSIQASWLKSSLKHSIRSSSSSSSSSCRSASTDIPDHLSTSPYHSSPPEGLQGYILCLHISAICKFELVALLLLGHISGSIGVHHLRARPCFSSSVNISKF